MPTTTMLIDLSSILYRSWFALPDSIRTADGEPIHGAYGFLNMLARLVEDHRPRALACGTDDDWRPQWRVDLIESYKAHRVADADAVATDENLGWQEEVLCEVLAMAGIAVVGAPDWEAEDAIGTLAAEAEPPIAIVSGDRDLFQLARDPDVFILYPKRGVSDLVRVDEGYIAEKYGIPGHLYADFAILRGDPSDGLPGVRGVGEKTAAALVTRHGRVEDVVAAALRDPVGALGKIATHVDYIERAAKVARITADAPCGGTAITLPLHAPDPALQARADALGLASPVTRLLDAINAR